MDSQNGTGLRHGLEIMRQYRPSRCQKEGTGVIGRCRQVSAGAHRRAWRRVRREGCGRSLAMLRHSWPGNEHGNMHVASRKSRAPACPSVRLSCPPRSPPCSRSRPCLIEPKPHATSHEATKPRLDHIVGAKVAQRTTRTAKAVTAAETSGEAGTLGTKNGHVTMVSLRQSRHGSFAAHRG